MDWKWVTWSNGRIVYMKLSDVIVVSCVIRSCYRLSEICMGRCVCESSCNDVKLIA